MELGWYITSLMLLQAKVDMEAHWMANPSAYITTPLGMIIDRAMIKGTIKPKLWSVPTLQPMVGHREMHPCCHGSMPEID